ncbi:MULTISPECIES: DUF7563 family protein [Haloprofundus]|uniref:DUF7563 family protein n=1 Tax=Haloprofundus TaxID=1911573 RepID=UPI000E436659|nr:hypothetical protein [Haloprofundus sp. MHR1]
MADLNWNGRGASNTSPRCSNCGRHVTPQFARVFGDNIDDVHGCLDCTTSRERQTGEHIPQQRMNG